VYIIIIFYYYISEVLFIVTLSC